MAPLLLIMSVLHLLATFRPASAEIGVCYGTLGDNIPPAAEVISLFNRNNITRMRIYDPNPATLQALRDTNIQLLLDVPNESLQALGSSREAATSWVRTHVAPHAGTVKFRYIAVGNEVKPTDPSFQYIVPAIQNIHSAISAAGGGLSRTKVTTSVSYILSESFPPSAGSFDQQYDGVLRPLLEFLESNGAPLLVNVYPFFAYQGDPQKVGRDYALFLASGNVVVDQGRAYSNLLDASVDAVYSALEKYDAGSVKVVVSETGWPTAGGGAEVTTVENARLYNNNLVKHIVKGRGTPKRPGEEMEAYIFAMFNENQKQPAGIENNWGMFYPDKSPVYPMQFH
ncbi:unnamed protein product [Linum trigynum]|uniref:glucan endo-1,3-beta-D-glucosidase n=1 Tax=Linum trigynum TaxID=586398 RepID=A0AAV2C7P1_9ROSI